MKKHIDAVVSYLLEAVPEHITHDPEFVFGVNDLSECSKITAARYKAAMWECYASMPNDYQADLLLDAFAKCSLQIFDDGFRFIAANMMIDLNLCDEITEALRQRIHADAIGKRDDAMTDEYMDRIIFGAE